MIECRNIAKGKGKGELIVSSEPISFLGGVNPENGEVIDPNHELKGQIISNLLTFVYEKTGRRPIILPVILNIKK